jgi:hypothetical protein
VKASTGPLCRSFRPSANGTAPRGEAKFQAKFDASPACSHLILFAIAALTRPPAFKPTARSIPTVGTRLRLLGGAREPSSSHDWRLAATSLMGLSAFPGRRGRKTSMTVSRLQFLVRVSQDSCHISHPNNPLNRLRFNFADAATALLLPFSKASGGLKNLRSIADVFLGSAHPASHAVRSTGGAVGRISAKATWTMPAARPSATPIRQASV